MSNETNAVPLDARERAQKILWTFMQTIDGDRDYSCDKCELDTYLCPHLFERLQNLIAAALTTTPAASGATPSISAAIAEVERLRDEYESGYEHYAMSGAPTAAAIYKLDAANEILEALRTLQPSTLVDKETDHAE